MRFPTRPDARSEVDDAAETPDGQPGRLHIGRFSRLRPPSPLRVVADPSPTLFWTILVSVGLLCLIGLVFVLSASMVDAGHNKSTSWYWFLRQAFFLGVGAVAMWVAVRVDYHRWIRLGPLVLIASVAALVLVLVPTSLRHEINGARRWLGPDSIRFQPSELAKLGLVLWLAGLLERRRAVMRDYRVTILPAMCVLGVVAVLIVGEPDLGTTTLVCCITVVMLAVAGTRLDVLAGLAAPAAALGLAFSMRGYHRARLLAFLDPWAHANNAGWQTLQSQVGLASGGLVGVGIGNSKAKWGFLPEAHTDFIFAIIGEEAGLVGCVVVLGLFLVFISAGVNAGRRAADLSGMLLAVGISSWIGIQALVNMGVAVGALPNKGITLPFVSYGGTSLIMTMFATGILLNVAKAPGTVEPALARRR
ncbi:MAG: putative lipid II flippase FtsW [Microthrixaceae bacterium]|nr:putative lipid II flippase FtsW [Microthrixaceae bacterium]